MKNFNVRRLNAMAGDGLRCGASTIPAVGVFMED